ncbi:MAG: GntR family transcriptional regulator [Enterococcus sp.]
MQKYLRVSNDIRSKIMQGKYQANEQLPSEKELCLKYDSSKMTVKKALDILVSEGLIIKRRGSGTFVKDLSIEEIERITVANQFRGMTALNPENNVSSKVLDFSVVEASEIVQNKLNLTPGSFVYDLYRVRFLDGKPQVIEKTFMPIDLIPGLRKENLEKSIYEYIEGQLDLKIQSAHRTVTVRKALAVEVEHLAIAEGDPVAVAEQVVYLDKGTAFEYSTSVHRQDAFSVKMVLNRD